MASVTWSVRIARRADRRHRADMGPVPEGPSIVTLKEEAARFAGRTVQVVRDNRREPVQRRAGRVLRAVRSGGKRQHCLVHTRTHCPRDGHRLAYRKHLGRAQRRAFFRGACQHPCL
jgi:hypothetical protein